MDQPVRIPDHRAAEGAVARRLVFYIPGFDPFPPRRYRELYRKEGQAQAAISGYDLAIASPEKGAAPQPYGWRVEARVAGQRVESVIEVLAWADIVRATMNQGVARTYLLMCATAWTYLRSGAFWRILRLRKGPAIAALYPVAMLLWQGALAAAVVWAAAGGAMRLAGGGPVAQGLAMTAGAAAGGLAGGALLRWFRRMDHRFYTYYMMLDSAAVARSGGAPAPELQARMAHFARRIRQALDSGADEVLVVGHSFGAHLAVSVLADVLRDGRARRDGPALGLLTLGHVVPMASFLPGARQLRADLRYLSVQDRVTWVDVSAPGDGCSFALCDPVAVSGAAGPGKRWPLVISAAFSQTLSPARWKALRWRFLRLHFQYLLAFDRPGDYDYFLITAGPRTLAARFAGRQPSKSRIERAASGFGLGQ
jgi:hypothetical protein